MRMWRVPLQHRAAHVTHQREHRGLRNAGLGHLGGDGVPEVVQPALTRPASAARPRQPVNVCDGACGSLGVGLPKGNRWNGGRLLPEALREPRGVNGSTANSSVIHRNLSARAGGGLRTPHRDHPPGKVNLPPGQRDAISPDRMPVIKATRRNVPKSLGAAMRSVICYRVQQATLLVGRESFSDILSLFHLSHLVVEVSRLDRRHLHRLQVRDARQVLEGEVRGNVPGRIRRDVPGRGRRLQLLPVPDRRVLGEAVRRRARRACASASRSRKR